MKISQLTETTAGATASGSVASVAMPMGEVQSRNKPEKAPKVKKGKKYVNTISEGKMKEIDIDLKELSDAQFKKKYNKTKEEMKQSLKEDEILEQDLIIVPGMRKSKDSSFIPHDKDRRDHEVEMARSDLYAAAKDAMRIYKMIQNRSEDEGLMGWQQSYITLAADYLNSVADSIEHDAVANEGAGVIAAGGVGESEYIGGSGSQFVPSATLKALDQWLTLSTQRDTAVYLGQIRKAKEIMKQIGDLEDQIMKMKKGPQELENWKETFRRHNGSNIYRGISRIKEGGEITPVQGMSKSKSTDLLNKNPQDHNKKKNEPQVKPEKKKEEQGLHLIADDLEEGQIYSTGGGAGEGWRWYKPKPAGLEEITDFKRREIEHELRHERNNYAVAIDGKVWKIFSDERQANNIARSLQRKGKKATVHLTGASPTAEGYSAGAVGGAGLGEEQLDEKCWDTHKQVGMKKKGGKMVPNCVPKESVEENEQVDENLRKWFKEKWVRFGPDGKIRGDCARGDESEGKPKCLPQSKAHSLGKKGRASAASRKRREDPNPERSGKAINVATKKKTNEESCPHCGGEMVHESLMNEKKDACYYKVKSRYKVWPSAYASGALVKCRKKGASNWGKSKTKESSIFKGIQSETVEVSQQDKEAVAKGIVDHIRANKMDLLGKYGIRPLSAAIAQVAMKHYKDANQAAGSSNLWAQEVKNMLDRGVFKNIKESEYDEFRHQIGNLLKQNPKGSAAEKMILNRFLATPIVKDFNMSPEEWIGQATKWLAINQKKIEQKYPEVDLTDLLELAFKMYEDYISRKGQLEEQHIEKAKEQTAGDSTITKSNSVSDGSDQYVRESVIASTQTNKTSNDTKENSKTNESAIKKGLQREESSKKAKDMFDDEVKNLIKKIWQDKEVQLNKDQGRYLVYSQNTGLEIETDSLEDAVFSAELIAKRNLDSPALVYDRETKFPVVAYFGSEDLWYQKNRLHEKWSTKYKRSINCNNPKGFSQKAHCAGRKK